MEAGVGMVFKSVTPKLITLVRQRVRSREIFGPARAPIKSAAQLRRGNHRGSDTVTPSEREELHLQIPSENRTPKHTPIRIRKPMADRLLMSWLCIRVPPETEPVAVQRWKQKSHLRLRRPITGTKSLCRTAYCDWLDRNHVMGRNCG